MPDHSFDDPTPRDLESGLTKAREHRMLARALRNGWLHGQRFPTDATAEDLQRLRNERALNLREKAVVTCHTDVLSSDARVRRATVRNVVAMEQINQQDEREDHRAAQALQLDLAVVGGTEDGGIGRVAARVRVVEDDDWYDNADRLAALAARTPTADPAVDGTIQAGGVRQALGQNGDGPNGSAEGPRPAN